jgi:prepilin-type N-terminal cleavage/methylation domain-containing protein
LEDWTINYKLNNKEEINMLWLRKSKKGFTLVELMVVVAIIGILALLGLRLFLMQQVRAKNAICKANAATIHTIIQGNLADESYATALLAVNDVRMANGITELDAGDGSNIDNPAGMKNPHLTADANFVVKSIDGDYASTVLFIAAAQALGAAAYAGTVIVGDTAVANKFYIVPLDNLGIALGEVYVAQK